MRKLSTVFLLMCSWLFIGSHVYAQPKVSDQQAIDDVILALYPDNQAEVTIKPLHGGFSGDRLYRVKVKDDILLVRINHQHKELGTKKLEVHCIDNAYNLGIGPKLLYQADDLSVIATEFVQGEPLSMEALRQDALIQTFAKNLKKLHSGAKFERTWSVFNYIKHSIDGGIDQKYKSAFETLNEIEASLKKANFPLKPSHNDIQQNNLFLVDGNNIQFIDWGDAGMSSPFWDLARASMEFAFYPEQDKLLLEYYSDNFTKVEVSRFWLMKQVFLLRTFVKLYNLEGGPDQESLSNIIKIFNAKNYPLKVNKNEQVTWQQIALHALALFEKNSRDNAYKVALQYIKETAE